MSRTALPSTRARRTINACISMTPSGSIPIIGLVEDHHQRVLDQGVGETETLPHAPRVAADHPIGDIRQPDFGEQVVDPTLGLVVGNLVEASGVAQVLAAGELVVEPGKPLEGGPGYMTLVEVAPLGDGAWAVVSWTGSGC